MTRNHRGRQRSARVNQPMHGHKGSSGAVIGSGSHSPLPAGPDFNYANAWVEHAADEFQPSWDVEPDQFIDADWNNPIGDNTWEWEAAGDESIASDDPFREKKLAWRRDNDHVYSAEHRVSRWREELPVKQLSTSWIGAAPDSPPEAEIWDGMSGRRLRSRERSRSKGRQGKKERAAKAEAWRRKVEAMVAEVAFGNDTDSSTGSFTEDIQAWLNNLVKKPKWRHVEKDKAKAFFQLSMVDKVARVEELGRALHGNDPWAV